MKALVVYASLTGNTEEMAFLLGKELKKLNIETEVEECMQLYPDEFEEVDICVVATYTYGTDGDLPDEILDFYDDLAEVDLSGKVFGVLGSGQDFYEHFCRSVDDFEKQFKKTKAVQGTDSLKFELNVKDNEINRLTNFAKNLVEKYNSISS